MVVGRVGEDGSEVVDDLAVDTTGTAITEPIRAETHKCPIYDESADRTCTI